MARVIKIVGDIAYLGYPDGHMEKIPISAFEKMPSIGSRFEVYRSNDGEFVLVPTKKTIDVNSTVQNVSQNIGDLSNIFTFFHGRMTRGEYIIRLIASIIFIVVICLIGDEFRHSWRYKWVSNVCGLAFICVSIWWLSCFVRRLHDIGLSSLPIIGGITIVGLFLFFICIAFKLHVRFAGPLVVLPIWIGFKDSQPYDNEYGPYKGN